MQNVEFKAELRDPALARAALRAAGAQPVGTMTQTDTYYRVASGRLKRRETVVDGEPEAVEIIHYERHDRTQPKISRFTIYSEEEAAERFGTLPLPVWLSVHKVRELYMLDHVRVHLDEVQGLGRFIEFEGLVTAKNNVARCHEAIAELRRVLGPALGEAIAGSYADMIAGENA